jgi:hypothetical protein
MDDKDKDEEQRRRQLWTTVSPFFVRFFVVLLNTYPSDVLLFRSVTLLCQRPRPRPSNITTTVTASCERCTEPRNDKRKVYKP